MNAYNSQSQSNNMNQTQSLFQHIQPNINMKNRSNINNYSGSKSRSKSRDKSDNLTRTNPHLSNKNTNAELKANQNYLMNLQNNWHNSQKRHSKTPQRKTPTNSVNNVIRANNKSITPQRKKNNQMNAMNMNYQHLNNYNRSMNNNIYRNASRDMSPNFKRNLSEDRKAGSMNKISNIYTSYKPKDISKDRNISRDNSKIRHRHMNKTPSPIRKKNKLMDNSAERSYDREKSNYNYKNYYQSEKHHLNQSNISESNKAKYDKAIMEINSLYAKNMEKKEKMKKHQNYNEDNNSQFSSYNKNSLSNKSGNSCSGTPEYDYRYSGSSYDKSESKSNYSKTNSQLSSNQNFYSESYNYNNYISSHNPNLNINAKSTSYNYYDTHQKFNKYNNDQSPQNRIINRNEISQGLRDNRLNQRSEVMSNYLDENEKLYGTNSLNNYTKETKSSSHSPNNKKIVVNSQSHINNNLREKGNINKSNYNTQIGKNPTKAVKTIEEAELEVVAMIQNMRKLTMAQEINYSNYNTSKMKMGDLAHSVCDNGSVLPVDDKDYYKMTI